MFRLRNRNKRIKKIINNLKTMKIYNNQEEVEKDVVNWKLKVDDDIKFTFNLNMKIDIDAYNIYADNVDICINSINAININVNNIIANIIVSDIIKANNIKTNNIEANNIKADYIKANILRAKNIEVNYIDNNLYKKTKNSKNICLYWKIDIINH